MCVTAQEGEYRKDNYRSCKIITPAKLGCKPAGHWHNDYIAYCIGCNYPAYLIKGCTQVSLHIIERHIHNG